jgi:hypothetical protein
MSIYRLPLLALAGLALLAGLWAGLLRLGWAWPVLQPRLLIGHGPLMVSGFLGTLILLERAVALGRVWPYLGVALNGLGGLLLLLGVPGWPGPLLLTLGSLWMVFVFGTILRQHRALYTATMAGGAICWLVGNAIWLSGAPVYQVVLWWAAFLVLTIAGERLELSRVTRLSATAHRLFLLACLVLVCGLVVLLFSPGIGWRLFGFGLAALAAWLFTYDISRWTVRQSGLPRYIAWCLLTGYTWLAVSGVAALVAGQQLAGLTYDFILHGIFVGFVISMVFGHAPIIFPAILEINLAYASVFYLPLFLLHGSLLLRLGGDLAGVHELRLWGGLFNALAILLFLVFVARVAIMARIKPL